MRFFGGAVRAFVWGREGVVSLLVFQFFFSFLVL
jgi:hypothetical protein